MTTTLPNPEQFPAVVMVDGAEFLRIEPGENADHWFRETVRNEGGEVALLEWKPRHGIWLRSKLSITARVGG